MNKVEQQRLKRLYEQQLASVDPSDQRRLRQARQKAMQNGRDPSFSSPWLRWGWLPAGALASLLVVFLWPGSSPNDKHLDEGLYADVHDMEILLDEQSLEFYSDLEFYLWLEEEGATNVL